MFRGPRRSKRPAVHQDDDGGGSSLEDRANKIFLHASEVKAGDIVALSVGGALQFRAWVSLALVFSHNYDRYFCIPGGADSFSKPARVSSQYIASLHGGNSCRGAQLGLDSFENGDNMFRGGSRGVIANLIHPVIRIRADDCH